MNLQENIHRIKEVMGIIEEQKIQLPITITGTYIANNCDELHAFQSTSGKVIGNMNVIVGKKLEEIYNSGINPKPIEVIVKVNNMTVSWSVTIDKSNDGKAWVGFTSRGAGCNNDVINRANSEIAGNDIETLKAKILNTYGENNIDVEEVNDFIYQNQNNGFRQIFYRYTKPKSFPSLESGKKEISINESSNKGVIDLINEKGLITAVKFLGGYDELINLLGDYKLPKEVYIKAIEEFMNIVGEGLAFSQLNKNPIPFKETSDEYHELGYIGPSGVTIDVFLPNESDPDSGRYGIYKEDYHLPFEKLSYKTIKDIFEMIVEMDPTQWH